MNSLATLRYSIVLPVFNEGPNIAAFCRKAKEELPGDFELLVCYDFEQDNTLPALAALSPEEKPANVRLVKNDLGRGVRYAIDAGMRAATAPVVVVMMADLSDDFAKVGEMVRRVEAGADVVCASRYMRGGKQVGGPLLKGLMSRTAGVTLHYCGGLPTHDPTNSFKAYRREFLQKTPIESTAGFSLGMELTVKAHYGGRRVEQVPATWLDRTAGQSRFKLMAWLPLYLRWYFWAMKQHWLPMRRDERGSRIDWPWLITGLLTFFFSSSVFVPWRPKIIHIDSLDESWMLAFNALFGRHLQFGREVIFTYGPWGFLDTGIYHPQTYVLLLFAWIATAIACWYAAWTIGRKFIASAAIVFGWLIITLAIVAPTSFVSVLLLLATCHFFVRPSRFSKTEHVLILLAALASQVKFSYCLMAIVILAPIGLNEILERRLPRAWLAFSVWFLIFYLLSFQRLSSLPQYLRHSFQLTGAYGEAMSFTTWIPTHLPFRTPPIDLVSFLFCGAVILLSIWIARWRLERWMATLPLAAFAGAAFLLFKWGFVRQDFSHVAIATLGLLALTLLCLPSLWRSIASISWRVALVVCLGLLGGFYAYYAHASPDPLPTPLGTLGDIPRNFVAAARLATGHSHLHERYESGLAEIRRASPLPTLGGTVDVYPCNGAAALAYGFDYQPRPVMQSYVAMVPELMQLNADHLAGPQAPQNVLFIVVKDEYWLRHIPAADDSLSWPLLLSRYDFVVKTGGFLVLHQSPRPREYSITPISHIDAGFDTAIPIPATSNGAIWTRITLHQSSRGKLLSLLYKDPEIEMVIQTRDGRQQAFRIIASEVQAGFLLSPLIEGNSDFTSLIAPDWQKALLGKEVESIQFRRNGWIGKPWAYDPNITIEFSRLDFLRIASSRKN